MKKSLLFLIMMFIPLIIMSQSSSVLDNSIDSIWEQSQNPNILQQVGPEGLAGERIRLIPPAPANRNIPGNSVIQLPIEQTSGPLNASPNDSRAYILYNRATIAFQNNQFEQARTLYRELVRRYPDSSYTPYSLYVLSLSENDFRRKIRILLTIKERFPNFPQRDIIIDSLGELYYLLGSLDSAEEVLQESQTYTSYYLQAMVALDKQRPNSAIALIRQALNKAPDNEFAYKIYILYSEALINLRSYQNAITVLQKAVTLRPWAYDNGVSVLLNTGKAFYYNGDYPQSLYVFSLLRLRFSRSTDTKLSDQYIEALDRKGTVEMTPVPWIADNFDTLIQERPITSLVAPSSPSLADIQQMNQLPPTGIAEPSLSDVTVVPPMPIPVPPSTRYDVLVPLSGVQPQIDLVTITNTVVQTVTNAVEQFLTNRIFVVETNTLTNNFTRLNQSFQTNQIFLTNIAQIVETNNVVSYEPVILWRTNYRNINLTNLVTNVIDIVVTNERIELFPLQTTNYNFVNRNQDITNVIIRPVTNRYLEYGLNNTTNWREEVVRRRFVEIIPAWKTTYNTIDTNALVTNVISEVVTNRQLELVPRWISNLRTNNSYQVVDRIITNRRLRIAPRWITNYQVVQTNMRDVVITNVINQVQTNFRDVVLTNVRNLVRTNIREVIVTNVQNVVRTNLIDAVITNQRTLIATNFQNMVLTNVINVVQTNTREQVLTNIMDIVQTNYIEQVFTNIVQQQQPQQQRQRVEITNIMTNASQQIITNFAEAPPLETAQIQFAPMELNENLDAQIAGEEQIALLEEPAYINPVEEEQIKFVSQELTQLERLASQIVEKSAGIVGEYGFSNNRGYVIRIAELRDLSVANIVLRDISKLELGVPAGIYFRDSVYYIEIRAIKDKTFAETLYQRLYKLGYTDVQIFEQYEVTEYQE